jgi:catechol 2,3-dioxygenase-like lactoylglutathione lyase family enzyme
MNIKRIVPNIPCQNMEQSRDFYIALLGFEVGMDMGWIITLVSPQQGMLQLSLLDTAIPVPEQSQFSLNTQFSLSIEVEDVDAAYVKALALGIPVVYPITDEPWGVRRFHITDPGGLLLNILSHIS